MAAYVIVNVEVTNPEAYREYQQQVPPTVERHGGRFLVRGGQLEALEGPPPAPRMVVLEFPSVEQARAWYTSPEYQAIVPIRQRHAQTRFMAIAAGT